MKTILLLTFALAGCGSGAMVRDMELRRGALYMERCEASYGFLNRVSVDVASCEWLPVPRQTP